MGLFYFNYKIMKQKISILLSIFLLIISCKATKNNADTSISQEKPQVLLTLKENSLTDYPDFSLVNSNEELWAIFGAINSTRMPGIRSPEVDFNANSLLLVNINLDGEKYSDITLDQLKVIDNKLQVKYHGSDNNQDMLDIPNSYRVIKLIKIKKATSISKIEKLN